MGAIIKTVIPKSLLFHMQLQKARTISTLPLNITHAPPFSEGRDRRKTLKKKKKKDLCPSLTLLFSVLPFLSSCQRLFAGLQQAAVVLPARVEGWPAGEKQGREVRTCLREAGDRAGPSLAPHT